MSCSGTTGAAASASRNSDSASGCAPRATSSCAIAEPGLAEQPHEPSLEVPRARAEVRAQQLQAVARAARGRVRARKLELQHFVARVERDGLLEVDHALLRVAREHARKAAQETDLRIRHAGLRERLEHVERSLGPLLAEARLGEQLDRERIAR